MCKKMNILVLIAIVFCLSGNASAFTVYNNSFELQGSDGLTDAVGWEVRWDDPNYFHRNTGEITARTGSYVQKQMDISDADAEEV